MAHSMARLNARSPRCRRALWRSWCGLAAPGTARPHQDRQSARRQRGDLAFKRAMLCAIKADAERVRPEVRRSCATHYVRHVIPAGDSGYRSSAGYTADMGTDNGEIGRAHV